MQESTHKKEIVSEIIDNKGLSEGDFTINFKLTNQYQHKDPRLKTEDKMGTCQKYSFRGGSNINLNLITWFDDILFCQDSKFTYYTSTVHFCVMQEWTEKRQTFANNCTGPVL